MLRKTLVVLRLLIIVYLPIEFIFGSSYPSIIYFPFYHLLFPNGCGAWGCGLGVFYVPIAGILFAFTAWINSIDARSMPKPAQSVHLLKRDISGVIAIVILLITIVVATIIYLFYPPPK